MHCEKNICENFLKTILDMHDSPGSRQDAQDMHIREEIWLQPAGRREDAFYMPHVPYVLNPEEQKQFVDIITNIRTPSNYVGSIHKRMLDGKLQYMKTHDYHVLMQQVLHECIVHHEHIEGTVMLGSRYLEQKMYDTSTSADTI